MAGRIAERWRELNDCGHWRKHLLDPLDIDLRHNILLYGSMAQATYDAFNSEKLSKYTGSCRYSENDFFQKVGLVKGNPFKYRVTQYLYATSDVPVPDGFIQRSLSKEARMLTKGRQSNWIGFVAVATDEGKAALGRRDIVIAWRGTVQQVEWLADFDFTLESAEVILPPKHEPPIICFPDEEIKVHRGFLSIYTSTGLGSSARDVALREVERLVEAYKHEEISITITGHSLGAGLATLNAVDIVSHRLNVPKDLHHKPCHKPCPVTVFAFGSPRVGNDKFKEFFIKKLKDLHLLRITNDIDIVTQVPFDVHGYSHVGEMLLIYSSKSNYLKTQLNLFDIDHIFRLHNLEVYLHVVAGTQGSKGGFKLEVNRDIALVNKRSDSLKDECLVPANWWIEKNRGMVQCADGSWHENEVGQD